MTYALPEPGAYACHAVELAPEMYYDIFTGRMETTSVPVPLPSPLGTLTLEPGGKWRLSNGKECGTYRAANDGTLKFSGYLGTREFTSNFSAKDGAFDLVITYNSKPDSLGMTSHCVRRSQLAQMIVRGSVKPGITGKLVYTNEGRVYELDVATGRSTPLAHGTMGTLPKMAT